MHPKAKEFAKKALRKASLQWPEFAIAVKASRVAPNRHKCSECGEVFPRKEVERNHREPVMPVNKTDITMDEYISNLLCDSSKISIICIRCHENITKLQNAMRKFYKKHNK